MVSDMPEWKRSIFDKRVAGTADNLTITVSLMMGATFREEVLSFDGFTANEVNPLRLCVALRMTCTWRDRIPYWQEALEVAKQACILGGIDPNKALSGLLK